MDYFNTVVSAIRQDVGLRNLVRHSGVMYLAGFVSLGFTIAQQFITARFLGPIDYGLFATIMSSIGLAMLIFDIRTWELGNKLLARPVLSDDHEEAIRIITWLLLADIVIGLLCMGLVLILAQPLATYLLKSPGLSDIVRLSVLTIPFRSLAGGILSTIPRIHDRFNWLALKSIAYALARFGLIGGPAILNLGLRAVIIGAILAEALNVLALAAVSRLILTCNNSQGPLLDLSKPNCFAEGKKLIGQFWLSATLKGLQIETFVPLLALLTSPREVGIFRSGLDIAGSITQLVTPISIVLASSVIKSYEHHKTLQSFVHTLKQSTVLIALLTVPVTGVIIFLGPSVLPRMLGAEYTRVAPVASILAIGNVVSALGLWLRPALIAMNRAHTHNIIAAMMFILSVLSLVLLAPAFGALGGAIVMTSLWIILTTWLLYAFGKSLRGLSDEAQPLEEKSL